MSWKLSDFFSAAQLKRDAAFSALGNVDSTVPQTAAYCDSVFYLRLANQNTNVACVITKPELSDEADSRKGLAIVPKPRDAFYSIHEALLARKQSTSQTGRIHDSAIISPEARIGRDVTIAERVVITGEVSIGGGTFIDAGAIIGAQGLLYREDDGNHHRVRHGGVVRIGRNATILANAVVARAVHAESATIIGDHAIVGIATTIGHEALVGRNCVIAGNCVIARRAVIGDYAWVGSSSTVREHVKIGAHAKVKAGSVVVSSVPDYAEVSGNFAISHAKRMAQFVKGQS